MIENNVTFVMYVNDEVSEKEKCVILELMRKGFSLLVLKPNVSLAMVDNDWEGLGADASTINSTDCLIVTGELDLVRVVVVEGYRISEERWEFLKKINRVSKQAIMIVSVDYDNELECYQVMGWNLIEYLKFKPK